MDGPLLQESSKHYTVGETFKSTQRHRYKLFKKPKKES